jgi:hypothetical protein
MNLASLKALAANWSDGEPGGYTAEMFADDFPQFFTIDADGGTVPLAPPSMLNAFVSMADASIVPSRWGEQWRYSAGLFAAHYLALYLQSYAPASTGNTAGTAAASGSMTGSPASASLGDASVTYDTKEIAAASERWGAWNATSYGLQLATMARLSALAGSWIV